MWPFIVQLSRYLKEINSNCFVPPKYLQLYQFQKNAVYFRPRLHCAPYMYKPVHLNSGIR